MCRLDDGSGVRELTVHLDDATDDSGMNHSLLAASMITERIERRQFGTPSSTTRVAAAKADQPKVKRTLSWHRRTAHRLAPAT